MRDPLVHVAGHDVIHEPGGQCRCRAHDFTAHVARRGIERVAEVVAVTAGMRGHDDEIRALRTQ